MAYYATGPVAADILTVQAVQYAGFVADLGAVPDGQQRVDVTTIAASHQGGPNALVGRQIDVGDSAAPVLVTPTDADTLAARRPGWFGRLGTVYLKGRDDVRLWWPDDQTSGGMRRRARDVIQYEIPNWWLANAVAVAGAIAGRNWSGMTEAQIEACVAHLESLLAQRFPPESGQPAAAGIMRRWYDVGVDIGLTSNSAPNAEANGRVMHNYARVTTFDTGYTDTFSVESGVLTPRSPDYAWLLLDGYTYPSGFDPENPA